MAKAKGQYGVRRYRPDEIFLEKKGSTILVIFDCFDWTYPRERELKLILERD